ncbi:PREDICTED: AAA-ATPase At3g50940-like [Nicotiana attenuata]|uniref:Protein hyper-sensitivity-related 4 n=1 Tax=Nicotiana attenuata TaxID=49451 RepID=A0A314KKJ4_NICAT|nr:PREDICTED: AAA-ATPase At3g50940-like [Nicotiana attenuata]OIT29906.1 protein hyper-sensitivity-related 4 [Nicotiana attenuata]
MSSSAESKMVLAKTVLSTVGSVAATAMVVRTVVNEFLPPELHEYFFFGLKNIFSRFSNQLTMVIDEFDGLVNNDIYEAAEMYLGNKLSPNTRRVKISKPEKEKHINITMERDEEVTDVYNGQKFKWVWLCRRVESRDFYNPRDLNSTQRSEVRTFELTFHKKNKDLVLNSYLPYIIREAKLQKLESRAIKIHTVDHENMYDSQSMNLDHPATFETLAMDSELKDKTLKDLDRFVKRKDYYRKVGKAWKRGYLLYGPPGTGKSSLIAAMANYLNFDIYDLELTELMRNSDLRRLLVATANKSILVVEDIDCTIDLQNNLANRANDSPSNSSNQQESKVTLSGLLNFIDGLWSSCGDERIIIFTTNHIEKLDPALLRPGRMDMHIHMSYCTPCGFRLLATNYLGIREHKLFKIIEELIETAMVTPAEVAEQLLKEDEIEISLNGLINFLHVKIKEKEDAMFRKVEAKQIETNEKKESDEKETEENLEEKRLPNQES